MLTNIFTYTTAVAIALSSFTGCAPETETVITAASAAESAIMYSPFTAEYSERDCGASYDESSASTILLSASSAEISGNGASFDGTDVVIAAGGTYVVSGELSGVGIIVDAAETDKVQLVLKDASLASADGPAIHEKQCDKLFITLIGENSLSDSENYTLPDGEDEPDAALFAKHDLTINGSGTLCVNGAYKNGIVSKDDLKITGGTISVTSAEDGIRGRDSVYIKDGSVTVNAGGDGIKSNNDSGENKGRISIDGGAVTVISENDGIQAESVLQINGGTINIKSGNEENAPVKTNNGFGGKGGMRPDKQHGGMDRSAAPRDIPAPPDGADAPRPDMQNHPIGMSNPPAAPDNITPPANGITQSSYTDTQTESESKKGIKSANAVYINGGNITVSAEDDAVHADTGVTINDGMLSISTADDAVHAEYSCTINGGTINVSKCYEGLEGKTVTINGGTVDITASDDGLNAADPAVLQAQQARGNDAVYIEINGGTVNVVSASDSLDANGNIFIRGGNITLDGPSSPMDCAIDCDGKSYISGGTLAASGAANGSVCFDASSSQASLMMIFSANQAGGTSAVLYSADGRKIAEVTPSKSYGGVIFSSPDLKTGETYTVKSGDVSVEVTLHDTVTSVTDTGEAISSAMGGGMRPDRGNGGKNMKAPN